MTPPLPGWRLAVAATLLSALVSLGFSIAGLLVPTLVLAGATWHDVGPFAAYAAVRSAVIAGAALVIAWRRVPVALLTIGWIAGAVQGLDAVVGIVQLDVGKTIGPAVLATFSAVAMTRLRRGMAAVLDPPSA